MAKKRTQERIKKLRKKLPSQEKCSKCGKTIILESPDAKPFTIKDKPVCKDCWCREMGEEVEKHPLKRPFNKGRQEAKEIPKELLKILNAGVMEGVVEYLKNLPRPEALRLSADFILAVNKESLSMTGIAIFLKEIASEKKETN